MRDYQFSHQYFLSKSTLQVCKMRDYQFCHQYFLSKSTLQVCMMRDYQFSHQYFLSKSTLQVCMMRDYQFCHQYFLSKSTLQDWYVRWEIINSRLFCHVRAVFHILAWILILLHTILLHSKTMCHHPATYSQGHNLGSIILKLFWCVRVVSSTCLNGFCYNFTQLFFIAR